MHKYDSYTPEIPYDNPNLPDLQPLPDSKQGKPNSGKNKHEVKSGKSKSSSGTKVKSKVKKGNTDAVSFATAVKKWANGTTLRLLVGVLLGCVGVYLLFSFFSYLSNCISDMSVIDSTNIGQAKGIRNMGGEGGARLSEFLINRSFGVGSIVIIFWCLAMSLKMLAQRPKFKTVNFTIKCIIALLTVSLIVGLLTLGTSSAINWGGYHGRYVNEFIVSFVGWMGAGLLCLFMLVCFIVICLRDVINWISAKRAERKERQRIEREQREKQAELERNLEEMRQREEEDAIASGETLGKEDEAETDSVVNNQVLEFEDAELADTQIEDDIEHFNNKSELDKDKAGDSLEASTLNDAENTADKVPSESTAMVVNVNSPAMGSNKSVKAEKDMVNPVSYKFPSFDILTPGVERVNIDEEEQLENKERIRSALLDFGIPIVSITATVGPTVTLYEIVPDRGVRARNIRNLVDDIALNLAAVGVRIIAPIPGKGTVGIEVANRSPQVVSMQTVIKSKKFQETKYKLPIALGATINNDIYIADLAKMPHLLVAGATGQGKSVGLNVIITSLLYKRTPNELKFVLIDPKRVEFSIYQKIERHYLAKIPDVKNSIITDMENDVVPTLSSLCVEMDRRYELLSSALVRNIEEYNAKFLDKKLRPDEGHEFLPYIVLIADEFNDMLMTSGKEVEIPICRLAQKARAVGIHVILATQRPSADVITGKIKANFPARIAFKVTSGIDSKTILDSTGAQQLIGRGDMLINNNSETARVQCAFVDTPDVAHICEYVERQPYGVGPMILPEPLVGGKDKEKSSAGVGKLDQLFPEVARAVAGGMAASTSNIQTNFEIGFNRAKRIMDQLERHGIVGAAAGAKPRAVLTDPNGVEIILQSINA